MDRFIPLSLSSWAFHSQTSPIAPLASVDTTLLNLNGTTLHEGVRVFSTPRNPTTAAASRPSTPDHSDRHLGAMRDALEFSPGRVYSFAPAATTAVTPPSPPSPHFRAARSDSSISTASRAHSLSSRRLSDHSHSPQTPRTPIFPVAYPDETSFISSGQRTSHGMMTDIATMTSHQRKKRKLATTAPVRVLDAPTLRNDFYSNLISWSSRTNLVAVGLASQVYIWSECDGAVLLSVSDDYEISTVSFSDGDYLLVATKGGTISLYSQQQLMALGSFDNTPGVGICCIAWVPGDDSKFFAGDENGYVLYFEVTSEGTLILVNRFSCVSQQVCGIAVSHDGSQISVGGNDNVCAIWDVTDKLNPRLKFHLKHQAAVKAIAYCPWSRSLLATGGGSKDRAIRFWHAKTGTLLDAIHTKGQVTQLIWSKRKRQIVATFGFGDIVEPIVIAVYSYPRMEKLVQVESLAHIRILAAALSPDSSSICVGANDETVRFYELWSTQDSILQDSQENGVLKSDLIELCEGITKSGGLIR
ncbi:CYFA0S03e00452g1_1 [Cyberlindnera fabianii]|uniref:CYFA0S03e00452g1_1 n=1 Tax=Cyberlindnera fabianii TaxID=36022 RepID=A0A061ANI9_CYBFA|nr:Meiosis-specific APC/C activator protein AMA1 [Cyberlindnera fabianii]CDR39172.1 CYFA0S03e00452g1_1 [Cyberlindnera fabianii]